MANKTGTSEPCHRRSLTCTYYSLMNAYLNTIITDGLLWTSKKASKADYESVGLSQQGEVHRPHLGTAELTNDTGSVSTFDSRYVFECEQRHK